jgi:hypothetical protein
MQTRSNALSPQLERPAATSVTRVLTTEKEDDMRLTRSLPIAGLMLAACLTAVPATAAPLLARPMPLVSAADTPQEVQYRHYGRPGYGPRGYGYGHRGYGHRGYGHRGYGYGGAALGGLAAGAIIGGAIANSQARAGDADAYCTQRYRSYDPASRTYLNNDGNRYPCP